MQFDRFDRLNAELRQRGIYYHWVPFINSSWNEKDGAVRGCRAGICFDETSFRLQERFLKQMLTHRNSYTGLRYVDDPALCGIELANENSFSVSTASESAYAAALWQELVGLWHHWLVLEYGDDAGLRQAWDDVTFGPDESLQDKTISFPAPETDREMNGRRFAERRFSGWIEARYAARLAGFLRRLGLRVPVSGTNWTHGYFTLKAMADMGFSGAHTYHTHPDSWQPLTLSSWSHLGRTFAEHRCERYINSAQTANVPLVASEVNAAAPGSYRHEVVLSLAANAAFQDADMVLWFLSFGYPQDYDDPATRAVRDAFHLNFDPARIGLMPAASLLFHRRDVAVAAETVELIANDTVQRQIPANLQYPGNSHLPGMEWAAFLTRQQINFDPARPTPGAILLNSDPGLALPDHNGPVITGPLETISGKAVAELRRRAPAFDFDGGGSGASDTGELTYDTERGVLLIDTPRTQAVVGRLRSGPFTLSATEFDLVNQAGTVVVSCLDGRDLRTATRILVSCVADAANAGMALTVPADTAATEQPRHYTVADWGWPAAKGLFCESTGKAQGTVELWLW